MPTKFKIEAIFKINQRGYFVAAKLIDKREQFTLTENSKLGTVDIFPQTQIPRKLDNKGKLITDIWLFRLKNDSDFDKLKEGEIVELN